MKGTIEKFNNICNEGEILGSDNNLYEFHIGEWLSHKDIEIGCGVSFEVVDDEARHILMEDELRKFQVLVRIEIRGFKNG